MASKTNTAAPAPPSYIDFEPPFELKEKEDGVTLTIHVPDFKKEQMRVQVTKGGVVKVTGEKPTDAAETKWKRFHKEINKPENCDTNEIRAKFTSGRLQITMPRKVAPQAVQQPASTSSEPPHQEVADQKPKGRAPDSDERKADDKSYDQAKVAEVLERTSMLQKLQGNKKVILGFGVAAVTMIAIGVFVASKYGCDNISSSASLNMED